MRRILWSFVSLSLFFTALTAAPAQAAVELSLRGPSTNIATGEAFVLRGKASGAKLGTVVQLQRRISGTWTKVASKKLVSSRSYSFTRTHNTPGNFKYRIFKKAQLGQPQKTSPTYTAFVFSGMDVSVTVTRSGNVYDVSGTVNAGNRDNDIVLEGFANGQWNVLNNANIDDATGEFLIGTGYPSAGVTDTRLTILGNSSYGPFVRVLPSAGVVHLPVTPGTASTPYVNQLSGGQDLSFDFTAVAGTTYSVYVADGAGPSQAVGSWSMRQNGTPLETKSDYLWTATSSGPASFYYTPASNGPLADTAQVTVWDTTTVAAAEGVILNPSVQPSQWIRVTFTVASCPDANVFFIYNPHTGSEASGSGITHSFPPTGDGYTNWPATDFAANYQAPCEVGPWEIFVKRSDTTAGAFEFAWSHTQFT